MHFTIIMNNLDKRTFHPANLPIHNNQKVLTPEFYSL